MITLEGIVEPEREDSGAALIAEIGHPVDPHFFVRLHSYDSTERHPLMSQLYGKRVRIVITVEGDEPH